MIPGIGPKTVERLEKLGLTTLGALAACPAETLTEHFGANYGRDLQRRATFHGSTTVVTEHVAVSESRETTFDVDIRDPAEIEAQLTRLAAELCERLVRAERRGRTIGIKVRLDDWTTVTRARTLAVATNAEAAVTATALDLLREYAPSVPCGCSACASRRSCIRATSGRTPGSSRSSCDGRAQRVTSSAPWPWKPSFWAVAEVRSYSRPPT